MRFFWPDTKRGNIGHMQGYTVHASSLMKALSSAGVTHVRSPGDNYDFAVHACPPVFFDPIPNRRNILFTTTEFITLDLPSREKMSAANLLHFEKMDHADIIIVPTKFSRNEFQKFTSAPVETVPEGVDSTVFSFVQRKQPNPGDPFVYLWNGTSDPRKGPQHVWSAWCDLHRRNKLPRNAWLYFKTTSDDPSFRGRVEHVEKTRVILDSRRLPTADLVSLYAKSHCFVFPTCGEAWGLVLSEAQSTGLPSIWPNFSAMADWCDPSTGYALTDFKLISGEAVRAERLQFDFRDFRNPEKSGKRLPSVGHTLVAGVNIHELADAMIHVYDNYTEALERGRLASERMRANFTWKQAAEKFVAVCEKYARQPVGAR